MKVNWDDYSQYMETCSKPPTSYEHTQHFVFLLPPLKYVVIPLFAFVDLAIFHVELAIAADWRFLTSASWVSTPSAALDRPVFTIALSLMKNKELSRLLIAALTNEKGVFEKSTLGFHLRNTGIYKNQP